MKKFNSYLFLMFIVLIGISLLSLNINNNFNSSENTLKKPEKLPKQVRKKARADYFFNMLRDPKTDQIPGNIRSKELAHAKKISASLKKSNADAFDWYEVGPHDVGGRTRAIAVDVTNSDVVLAAGVSGGIWKSTDNGDTWTFKSKMSDLLSFTSIVQDPRAGFTNNWYASGGEFDGSTASDRGYRAYYRGNGIYKSTDNGESWEIINSTLSNPTKWDSDFDYVAKLLINPVTGSLFAASHGEGIIKSVDGGDTFELSLGGFNDHYYSDIIIKSNGDLVAVLSQYGYDDSTDYSPGVYTSSDDGETWTDITPAGFPEVHERSVLGTSQLSTAIFYVLTNTGNYTEYDNELVTLFKLSTDNSVTEDLTANLPTFTAYFDGQGHLYTQSNYNLAIAVKPDDDDFVLIAGTSLFRSTDGFSTKITNTVTEWIGGYDIDEPFYPTLHPDIHIITFDPNDNNAVWVGHDGGLSYTDNITDESYSTYFPWDTKNNSYNVTQFYTISISKLEGDARIIGGTQDNGSPFFKSNNLSFSTVDVSSGDGAYCHLADKIYAYSSIYEGNIYRFKYTSSGNMEWDANTTDVTPDDATGQLFINPFVIDPNPTERYMYYPAGYSLWRNDDIRGQNDAQAITDYWEKLSDLAMPVSHTITTLAVSDSNPEHVLYYGGYNSSQAHRLYRLENAHSATSGYTDVSIDGVETGAYIHHIAINPDNGNEIMVVFSNYNIVGLYHSTDGGDSYTAVEGNLTGDDEIPGPSLRRAIIFPYDGTTLYFLGTSTGLYYTSELNGDYTVWQLESSSVLGNVVVEALDVRPVDNTIAVATHGRGIFLGNPSGTVDVVEENISDEFNLNQNYPNPFNPSTKIEFSISDIADVNLTVFNSLGERVKTLVNKQLQKGNYSVNFNGSKFSSGIYYYKLSSGNNVQTKKMILLK